MFPENDEVAQRTGTSDLHVGGPNLIPSITWFPHVTTGAT